MEGSTSEQCSVTVDRDPDVSVPVRPLLAEGLERHREDGPSLYTRFLNLPDAEFNRFLRVCFLVTLGLGVIRCLGFSLFPYFSHLGFLVWYHQVWWPGTILQTACVVFVVIRMFLKKISKGGRSVFSTMVQHI